MSLPHALYPHMTPDTSLREIAAVSLIFGLVSTIRFDEGHLHLEPSGSRSMSGNPRHESMRAAADFCASDDDALLDRSAS